MRDTESRLVLLQRQMFALQDALAEEDDLQISGMIADQLMATVEKMLALRRQSGTRSASPASSGSRASRPRNFWPTERPARG